MNETQANRGTDWRPVHALALLALMGAANLVPPFRIWPLLWLVPLAAYGALVIAVAPLRVTFRPWRFGRVSASTTAATVILGLGSCAALVTFHRYARPDISVYSNFLPVSAPGGMIVAGVLFSVFNALFEEVIFRGILFDAIESQWGNWVAVIATAFVFGYGHMRGYPPGPTGALLAGIFGLCLGWLRGFSGGIGLPVMAHIVADATIYTIIARSGDL